MKKTANSTANNKISTFVLAAIYVTLILSVLAIVVALGALSEGSTEAAIYLLAVGFIALGLSGYYLFISRKHVANLKTENPQILTTIECEKCKEKVTREFKRGDFVFKEMEKCPKCDGMGMIVAIYREVKEKEKPSKV